MIEKERSVEESLRWRREGTFEKGRRRQKDNSAAVAEFWHAFPLRSNECDFTRFADYIAKIREPTTGGNYEILTEL